MNRDYIPLYENRDFEVYSIQYRKTAARVPFSLPEPVFKTKKMRERVNSMNRLFLTVFINVGLGANTLTFC